MDVHQAIAAAEAVCYRVMLRQTAMLEIRQADEAPNSARFDALLEFVRDRRTDSSA